LKILLKAGNNTKLFNVMASSNSVEEQVPEGLEQEQEEEEEEEEVSGGGGGEVLGMRGGPRGGAGGVRESTRPVTYDHF
jgi:hypothetical protein